MNEAKQLVFSDSPNVEFASNLFKGVPVILQCDETPLIEMVSAEQAGFTTQISIFHRDGTYLAKVKGSQMYLTEDGKKTGLKLRHPGLLTVCEMGSKTLFELRRDDAAALKLTAELYTPTGGFIKGHDHLRYVESFATDEFVIGMPQGLRLGLKDLTITADQPGGIGVCVHSEGYLRLAVNCKINQFWKGDEKGPDTAHMWLRLKGSSTPEGTLSNLRVGPSEVIEKYALGTQANPESGQSSGSA